MRSAWAIGLAAGVVACAAACGSAGSPGTGSSSQSTSPPDGADAAEPEPAAPAAHPPVAAPAARSEGGAVLRAPRVVAFTFDGDPMRGAVEPLVASLPGSAYWAASTREYGAGDLSAAPPVRVAASPPRVIDDGAIVTWLAGRIGTPDPDAIYLVVYPRGTTVTVAGFASCDAFVGYHAEADVGGVTIAYAVVARCDAMDGLAGEALVTTAVTHELVEAATNPRPATDPAWDDVDDAHAVWSAVRGGELGDLCGPRTITTSDVPFAVQRTWSNAAASAGHDPCVPAPDGPYFSAAVDPPDDARLFDRATKGVRVPLGESRTVDVVLACDAPACDPWDVTAVDLSVAAGGPPELDLSLDRSRGAGGDVLRLTIRAVASEPGLGGGVFALVSARGDRTAVSFAFVDERPW